MYRAGVLALVAALALASCGTSGGADGSAQNPSPTRDVTTTTDETASSTTGAPVTTPAPPQTTTEPPTTTAPPTTTTTGSSLFPGVPMGVTRAQYDQVQDGMTLAQVAAILGSEGKVSSTFESDGYKHELRQWLGECDGRIIFITFDDGLVTERSYSQMC
jgi:hypothetical protein